MTPTPIPAPSHETACAPASFRAALADLVEVGMRVATMIGLAADAEAALAQATMVEVAAGGSAIATS
ncbi:hypothetical protein, partial [Acidisphaera sp. L21]|uniref:hypothetical protein n=1 Tax=Acidisphaera sp. L21 TaxID=1641851 RepID=UPI00131CDCFE